MLWANPTGANVVAGSAAINAQGNTLNVVTGSDRTIINWQDFSIGANEATNFIQPGANSAVLNRVTGGNPSAIYGQLNSNGNVFLINPNGIFIGPSGVINVNGFTASTFDIANQDFLDGAPFNFQGSSLESVINEGRIHTGAGGAALLGHNVTNNGTITSDGGAITLATGGSITLNDGSRYIQADINTLTNGLSETASLIKQSGTVRATGALKTGGEVYLVNPNGNILHNGTIQADKLAASGARTGGSVKLEAKQGTTTVAGTIDVSGETGGRAEVLGQQVELASANIDASGTTGGGEVLVGGDLRGGNPDVLNALSTLVDAASQVNVDSTESGNAGRAIYYAEEATEYYGHTSAAARGATGDGGFIEVSGGDLTFNGSVDLSSIGGEVGTVLLDPAVFNANASNIVSLRNAWGSGHLVIEADNAINIREDLYPAIGGAEIVAGTSNNLTLREESGAGFDGSVNILIDATVRNGNNTTSVGSQNYFAGAGNFSISADGSIEGRSFVQIQSATIDLQGPINNNNTRYFTATNDADIGIGTAASGTWKLTDDELAFLATNGHYNRFATNGDIDVNMTGANAFLGSVEFYANHDVTLNEFHGRNLTVYARNLSILGPVAGTGTFYFQQGSSRTLGIGNGAAGDVILDQAAIDQLSGFNRLSVGYNNSTGSNLDVNNADLSAFTSTELRGSNVTINGLTVNQNLTISHNGLNILTSVTKTSNGGSLQLYNFYAADVGLGDGTTGDIIYSQATLSNLGSYNNLTLYSGSGNMNVNADLSAFTGSIQLYARGEMNISNLQLGGSQLFLNADDFDVTGPVTGTGNTNLYLRVFSSTPNTFTLGDGPAADWTLDQDELDHFSGFGYLDLSLSTGDSLYVNADLTGLLNSNSQVNLRSEDMTIESLVVPQSLILSANEMDILAAPAGGVTTLDSTSQITINPYSSSNSVGLGDTASGTLHLAQAELDQIQGFLRYRVTSSGGIDIRSVTLPGSLDVDQNSSSQNLTIDGLMLTNPSSALDLYSAGELVGENITAAGNVTVRGDKGIRGFSGNRFGIDRQSTSGYTQFYSYGEGDILVEIDNPSATSYVYAYNANGSIDILAHGATRFNGIYANNPSMQPQTAQVTLATTSGDIVLISDVNSPSDITIDSAGAIFETTGTPLIAPGEISLFAVGDITGNGSGGYFDVRPDSKINAATSGLGSNIMLQTNNTGNLVLGDISTNGGTLYARANGYSWQYVPEEDQYVYLPNSVDAQGTINTGGAEIISQYGDVLITTLHASDDVLIQAGDDITVRASTITLTDGANITMRSLGDIHLNGSVQNASAAGGDVNLIAGWDGTTGLTTPFDMTPFLAADVATTTIYGRNEGSIFIGDSTQTEGIAVGSRNGSTHAFAYDLAIRGSTTTQFGFAQLGYRVSNQGDAHEVLGAINARLRNDILAAGGWNNSYAQIGHVGADYLADPMIDASTNASISIAVGQNIDFSARSQGAYAQLGHGGRNTRGDHSGEISILSSHDISFTAGTGDSTYAQLGHGGAFSRGNFYGDITLVKVQDIEFVAGDFESFAGYAQLGHGGVGTASTNGGGHGGNIRIGESRDIMFTGGGGNYISTYSQLGHGGDAASSNLYGSIEVNASRDLSLIGGSGFGGYSMIGHGHGVAAFSSTGTRSGDIELRIGGETSLVSGEEVWQIGHLTSTSGGISDGNVTLITGTLDYDADNTSTQVTLNQDFADNMEANLAGGHVTIAATNGTTGAGGGMVVDGAFLYDSPNNLSLLSTTDLRFNASVQNSNDDRGDVNIVAGWDGESGVFNPLDATDFGPFNPADFLIADVMNTDLFGNDEGSIFVGDSTQTEVVAVGSRSGNTNAIAHDITLDGSNFGGSQLGFRLPDAGGSASGDINVRATGDASLVRYAVIGHIWTNSTTSTATATLGGDIDIQLDNLKIESDTDYAGVGHVSIVSLSLDDEGTSASSSANAGESVSQTVDLALATSGHIDLLANGDISMTPGENGRSRIGHSQIVDVTANVAGGNGATGSTGNTGSDGGDATLDIVLDSTISGDIEVTVGSFSADGSASNSTASVGHLLASTMNLNLTGGNGGEGGAGQVGTTGSTGTNGSNGATGTAGADASVFYVGTTPIYGFGENGGPGGNGTNGGTGGTGGIGGTGATGGRGGTAEVILSVTADVTGDLIVTTAGEINLESAQFGHHSLHDLAANLIGGDAGRGGRGGQGGRGGIGGRGGNGGQGGKGGDGYILNGSYFTIGGDGGRGGNGGRGGTGGFGGTGGVGGNGGVSGGTQNNTVYDIALSGSQDIDATGAFNLFGSQAQVGHVANVSYSVTTSIGSSLAGSGGPGGFGGSGGSGGSGGPGGARGIGYLLNAVAGAPGSNGSTGTSRSSLQAANGTTGSFSLGTTVKNSDTHQVVSGNMLLSTNGEATLSNADIGHQLVSPDPANDSVAGDVILTFGKSLAMMNAQIGHRIDADDTYASGNTHIAVGTANYAGSNTTDALISDANSQITSSPDGELRLYLPRRSSFQMADGATLNGTDVNTFNDSTPFPNEQGGHAPFVGPYNIDAADGNFAFYYSLIELIVQAGSGSSVYGDPTTDPGWIVTNEVLSEAELASLGLSTDFALTNESDADTYTVNVTGDSQNPNYEIVHREAGEYTITQAPLSITALAETKTYGTDLTSRAPTPITHFTVDGLKNLEEVDGVGLTSTGYDSTASVVGGPYDIVVGDINSVEGSNGFNRDNYYIAESTGAQLTVAPFELNVVVDPISKEYGETVALDGSTGFTVTPFYNDPLPNGEIVTSLALQSAGAAANADVVPGGYAVALVDVYGSNGFDSSNYSTANYVPAILTVTPAPLIVRALDQTKTYGDDLTGQTPQLGTHFTVGGLKNNEVVDGVMLASSGYDPTASVNGGPYAIVASGPTDSTNSGFDTGNYDITFLRGQLTINPATLIVTALDQTKTYGDDLTGQTPQLGTHFTVRGLKNDEVVDGVTLASGGYDPTASVNGGPYAIIASGPTDSTGSGFDTGNYAVTFRRGQLTVNPAMLVVTALDQTKTYGDDLTGQTPQLGTHFTVGGLKNNEVVDGVTLVSDGYDPTASVNGGPYAIIASGPTDSTGSGFDTSNYDIRFLRGRLTVNPADLLIFANNQFKRSGIALTLDETSGFTAVGLKNGDTIESVALASAGSPASAPAGVYTLYAGMPVTGSADLSNYTVRFATGWLIVGEVSGEYVYDQFVRAEDQWRTLDSLLVGLYNRGDIRYGDPAPKDDGNLVQMNSFDLFD